MNRQEITAFPLKTFGFNIIYWRIDHFSFEAIRTKEDILFSSPEFCLAGIYATKWQLTLNPKMKQNGEYYFSVILEKLHHIHGPDNAPVDFKVCIIDNQGEVCFVVRYSGRIKNKDPLVITLESVNNIRDHLKTLVYERGAFTICCFLLANFEDCYKTVDQPVDAALKLLSEDLNDLYKSGTDYDVILRIKGGDIYAHKAVLCTRSPGLASMMKHVSEDMVLDLSFLDYDAVKYVVGYIYSGNMNCIAKNASILIYETVLCFELASAIEFFNPEVLDIRSEIDIERHAVLWTIKDLSEISATCILSPTFSTCCRDAKWRFWLYRQNVDPDDGFVSIFADVVEGVKPNSCYYVFTLLDGNGDVWAEDNKLVNNKNERLGIEKFMAIESFESKLKSLSEALFLNFEIFIYTDDFYSTEMNVCITMNFPENYYYVRLSNELGTLKNGDFSDVVLEAEGDSFKVSKCVVSARSRVLKSMLQGVSHGGSVHLNMKSNILERILHYIYSGVCDMPVESEVLEFYQAAEYLCLPVLEETLKEALLCFLQESISIECVLDILVYALDKNEEKLKDSAMNFIFENSDIFLENATWDMLRKRYPLRMLEKVSAFVTELISEK